MWHVPFKQLLEYLIAGTRGGPTRARILHAIQNKPSNAHQLAKALKLDYKTIQHHLILLAEHQIITVINKGKYGAVYFLSEEMEKNIIIFNQIRERFGNNLEKS